MTDKLVIIDYGSGNLRSAEKALKRAASDAGIDVDVIVSSDPADVLAADRIVLPGVGAFGDCGRGLRAIDGMVEALSEAVLQNKKPFLGICVGMQLIATKGIEHGTHEGLGWLDASVIHIEPDDKALKIPHMGWNSLKFSQRGRDHPVLAGLDESDHAYFVHSYHMIVVDQSCLLATTDYGQPLTAIVGRDNIIGFQFHPEKSQAVGLKLLTNFLRWTL